MMALMKYDPFRDIDRFFDDMAGFSPASNMGWDLAVDVYDDGNSIVAEMNLPGVDPQHVDVSVEDSHLRISGTREDKTENNQENYYTREIRRGSFERMVRLPEPVQVEQADAEFDNGVLRVTLPRAQQAGGQKIQIRDKSEA
jgi:HSP20 family protein